jgi:hypothetical protein
LLATLRFSLAEVAKGALRADPAKMTVGAVYRFCQIWVEKRLARYFPDWAGAEAGAVLEFSSTECELTLERW